MVEIQVLEHRDHKFLFIDGYLWMWDLPHEKELQRDLAEQAYGDVLVAGYGFGIVSQYALENPRVTSVTTVEQYPEVIETMGRYGPTHGEIIIGDFFDLNEERKYDCVIGDIWPEIDKRYLDHYVKFREKAQRLLKEGGVFLGWGKDYFEFLLNDQK